MVNENITSTAREWFKAMPGSIQVGVVVVILSATVMYVMFGLKNSNDEINLDFNIRKLELNTEAQTVRDSINYENAKRLELRMEEDFDRKLDDYILINKLVRNAAKEISNASHVTVFLAHPILQDRIEVGLEFYTTVIFTSDEGEEVEQTDISQDFQHRTTFLGYAWYYQQILKNREFYVPQVVEEDRMYFGNTKLYMDFINTRSMKGYFVKRTGTVICFVNVSFEEEFGLTNIADVKMQNLAQHLSLVVKDEYITMR